MHDFADEYASCNKHAILCTALYIAGLQEEGLSQGEGVHNTNTSFSRGLT